MASKSTTSSEGSELPQRHRPGIGNLARDTTEQDLWDLDGEPEANPPPPSNGPRRRTPGVVAVAAEPEETQPVMDEGVVNLASEAVVPQPRSGGSDLVRRDVPRGSYRKEARSETAGKSGATGSGGDVNLWDDLADELPELSVKLREEVPQEVAPVAQPQVKAGEPVAKAVEPAVRKDASKTNQTDGLEEGLSPVVRTDREPVSLVPKLALSGLERVGLIGFVVLLLAGGIFFFVQSIHRLPSDAGQAQEQEFPVQGKTVRVDSLVSYWREPVAGEVVRRGTVLIPGVELKVDGGPGALRVFFNDDQGNRVGDPINRAVEGAGRMKVAATAGFEDFSMHPAYRAGESERWTIEIFEGPSVNATGDAFKKLLEVPVSVDRR